MIPNFDIKPIEEGDNVTMDNTCESDEDLPLVIDCSEIDSSPVIDDIIKLNCKESETHFGSMNSACLNSTNTIRKEKVLDESDFNNKGSTNSKGLGHLDESTKSLPPIKMEQPSFNKDHISNDEVKMKSTYPCDDVECLAQCDIKIEYNELVVEEQSSNEIGDNLSNEMGAEASSNDSQPFMCDICPYQTSDETYFAVHKKTHRNKYRCNSCSYVSTSAFKLLHHQKKRHMTLEDLLYYCGDCPFTAMKRVQLVNHRREKHNRKSNPEPKYKCSDCSYKCGKKIFYRQHRVKEHKDILLKCSTCSRLFLDQHDYEVHSLVHIYKKTEEGLYECKGCDYRCENRHVMVYHTKMSHKTKDRV